MLHSARWLAILFLVTCQCFGQDAQPLAFHTVDGVDQPLFEMKSRVNAMTVSPDGRFLAVAAESGELAIWDLELGEMHERKAFSEGPLNAVAFHPDDNIVVFAGGSSAIEVWDLEQDFRKTLDGSEAGTSAVAFFGVGIAATSRARSGASTRRSIA